MVPGMEDGVGEGVESDVATVPAVSAEVGLRMLGPLRVLRDGAEARLPSSRKAAALLAYLALSPEPVPRSRLCDLFWDGPNDPRGELRWTLAKLRPLVDGAGRSRLLAADDRIVLDRGGMAIDALAVEEAFARGLGGADTGWLEALAARFDGEFLEGLRIDRCPQFDAWLAAQRRRFANCRIALHEELARRLPPDGDACLGHLEIWVALSPFDVRAHAALLGALVRRGRLEAGQAHLASTRSAFQAEGIDFAPVMTAWLGARRPLAKQEAEVRAPLPAQEQKASDGRRASLAVMPFTMLASPNGIPAGPAAGLAGSLAHDIITRLARLRSLFVIARGSVFALAEAGLAPDEAAQKLGVDYFACGTIRESGAEVEVEVELVEARSARIVWTEAFTTRRDLGAELLDGIGDRIVASIASEIETAERNRAILKPPSDLDAWGAYHRGLWHMYRFTRNDNLQARAFFTRSVALDPTYARAHAGLSFTHWQAAFQRWEDPADAGVEAMRSAGQSLIVDDNNPAAHWAMGRALWLSGRNEEAVAELGRCVALSPNFALGHYSLSFVQAQSGEARHAIAASDLSRSLSPYDPLLFGMMGARALAHARLGEFEEAADWALQAAARPNSHVNILAITMHCLALAGREAEARIHAAEIRKVWPGYRVDDFLRTFHFEPVAAALFRAGARRIGLD
jgi:DNA-binding SARP family transcriptional activator/tetratricopeptide (TPR) repeat protein